MICYIAGFIYVATVIAETQISPNWWEPILSSGPLGAVLLWFMFRSEKRSSEQTAALNNQTLMTATVILALKHGDASIAELAAQCKKQAERLSSSNENTSG